VQKEAKEAEERGTEVADSFDGKKTALGTLDERAGNAGVRQFVDWGVPIQRRDFEDTRKGSLELAAAEDPNETSS
jgi:hypothetical protein